MSNFKIYLAGGMSGLTDNEQIKWRVQIKNAITLSDFDLKKTPEFFIPPEYYQIKENKLNLNIDKEKYEREAMKFDLYNLRKSDLVIVNFNSPKSIGTAMELMLAKEHHIPVVGLNKINYELHPWLCECCLHIFNSTRDLVEFVVKYYLS